MRTIFLALLLTGILSSCAFHSGNISSGPTYECPMRSIVAGYASTTKFFGLGGLNKNALILSAKQDLYEKYLKNKNFKLTNFSVDFKTTYVLFYTLTEATVSADLYDCNESSISKATNNDSLNIAETKMDLPLIDGFKPGDSILYENNNSFYKGIYNYHTKGKYNITLLLPNGETRNEKVHQMYLFKTSHHPNNKTYFEYDLGEDAFVKIYVLKTESENYKPCKILGLNKTRLLITYIKDNGKERTLSVEKDVIRK